MLTKRLVAIMGVASLLVSAWLLMVMVFISSRVNPAAVSFWLGVMLGFFVLGAGSIMISRFPAWPRSAQIAAGFIAGIAILFGLLLLLQNEIQSRRSGDWEGYVTLIGLIAIINGIVVLVFLFQKLRLVKS